MIKNRTVLLLSLADAFSTLGDEVGLIALLWLVMGQSRNSVDMGVLAFLYGVPGLVPGPFFGIILDRWLKKWTVILANAAQSAIFLLIGLFTTHSLSIVLYGFVLAAGFLIPPTAMGSFVIMAEHVGEDQLLKANALNEIFSKVPEVVGPALGGWLITFGGIRIALWVDAASFLLAALATMWIPNDSRFTRLENSAAQNRLSWFSSIGRSLAFIVQSRVVLLITLVALMMNGAYGILEVSLPLLVHRQLHHAASLLGVIWMAYAIGTLAGAFSHTIIRMPATYGRVLAAMIVGWGVVIVGTGLVATPWGLLGGLAIAGVSFGAYPPIVRTLVQTSVPPEKRGEILSVRAALIGLGVPVGGLLAGVANTVLIPSTVIALTGALAALVGLMIWTLLQVTRSSK